MIRWVVFISFVIFVDFYAFQSVKTLTKSKLIYVLYWFFSIGILVNVIFQLTAFNRSDGMSQSLMLVFGLVVLSVVPKIVTLLVLFGEDIFRLGKRCF